MAITENESKLIAIFIQSCLWGSFAVMFILTCWTLLYRRPRGRPLHKSMLAVAILMFVLATMQLATNFTRIIRAFIDHAEEPEAFFNQLADFTQVFGSTTYILQTFTGDGVAIYRCYVVWHRRPVAIILPGILYTGSLVSGIGVLYEMSHARDGDLVFASQLGTWISNFFSFSLVTSTTCTFMIASRIWYLSNQITSTRAKQSLHPLARVIFESGALYSALLVALLILYGQKSWFQYVLVDMLSSLIGIIFSIIIIRIGLGIATDPDAIQSSSIGGSTTLNQDGVAGVISHELSAFEAASGNEDANRSKHLVKLNLEHYQNSGLGESEVNADKSEKGKDINV